jgi:D-arginine dehydrogenase
VTGQHADVLIAGAGIAGSSLAFELAARRSVVLLEREVQPGYHSTGRSAAMLTETYGTPAVRALARASRSFLAHPPSDFTDHPLLTPRGMLHIARPDQRHALETAERQAPATSRRLSAAEVRALVPLIEPGYVESGLLEPDAMAIDVSALHEGYLRGLRRRGGLLVTDAEIAAVERTGEGWRVETKSGSFGGDVLIDAAGAWADQVARLAGVTPIGLVAKRRTAILIDPPDDLDAQAWPMVIDVDEQFYLKPEGGKLLVSPADETPVAPGDAQPEELDVARAVDRYERLTGQSVRRVAHRWAGLRSFVADEDPVVGPDPEVPSFFWLAGQGGFGIMTAPALARIAASLITTGDAGPNSFGLDPAQLGPARLRRRLRE